MIQAVRAAENLVGFSHFLRRHGFCSGVDEVLCGMRAMACWPTLDFDQAHRVLRSLSCHTPHEWESFPELFRRYWVADRVLRVRADTAMQSARTRAGTAQYRLSGMGGGSLEAPELSNPLNARLRAGSGRQRLASKADFRFLGDRRAMRQVELLAERLARRMRYRLQRRYRVMRQGRCLDLRRTIRRNLCHGGEPSRLYYRQWRMLPLRLVILHDVSHSMSWNNPLLFRFARGLVRCFEDSEAFAFHTQLFKVSSIYRERSLTTMRTRLEQQNQIGMGGTCIADSLAMFARRYAGQTLSSSSIVLIISDGFDTNRPEEVAEQLKGLRRACRRLIWLNPMIGRNGYQPDRDSLLFSSPWIDRMFSANNLEALRQTTDYIVRTAV